MATQTDDETELLSIFPSEIWKPILEKVIEPVHYLRVSSASPFFQTFLLPRKNEVLFPEVSKILLKQLPPVWSALAGEQMCSRNQCSVNVLTLRHVNRAFRNVMDEWLQAHDFRFPNKCIDSVGWKPQTEPNRGSKRTFDKFEHLEEFADFEKHFNYTHFAEDANPFISRGIMLETPYYRRDSPEALEPYKYACAQLLQKYGHHIWYCRINLKGTEPHHYTEMLQTVMDLMPNLRALLIQAYPNTDPATNLEQNSSTIHFPWLRPLHTICVKNLCYRVFQALLQNNPQVRQVDTRGSVYLAKYCLELLPNLTAVSFEFGEETEEMVQAFEIFNCARVVGRVERLWLNASEMIGVPHDSIFRALESKFSESLTLLEVQLPSNMNGAAIKCGLVLPKLKCLKLTFQNLEPLDFLLPLKATLERLTILNDPRDRRGLPYEHNPDAMFLFFVNMAPLNDVKRHKFLGEPIQFSIWAHFPKLKLLETQKFEWDGTITDYAFTRDKWQAHRDAGRIAAMLHGITSH